MKMVRAWKLCSAENAVEDLHWFAQVAIGEINFLVLLLDQHPPLR